MAKKEAEKITLVPKTIKKETKPKNPRAGVTRAKAIRLHCVECMGFQTGLVKECPDYACNLWPFRMGRGQEDTDVPGRKK